MVTLNPDPHLKGYRFSPNRYVTAAFESCERLDAVLSELAAAGFDENELSVYVGPEGAAKLDVRGDRHGMIVRVLRELEEFFTDETDCLKNTDHVLCQGGFAVEVFTAKDEEKKARAVRVMKVNGAREVYYWGRYVVEKL